MCRVRQRIGGLAALLFAGVSLFGCSDVLAESIGYQIDYAFSGTAPASTSQPWIDAVFEDVTPGTVRLAVTNLNLSGSENVGGLYFNLNPRYSPSDLVLSIGGGSGSFLTPTVGLGADVFKADGDGKYDIVFSFDQGGTDVTRFSANEYFVWQIT